MTRPSDFRAITIAVLLATSLTLVASGQAAGAEGEAAEPLGAGSWSVQFSVQPNFTLGSYAGSTLSLKRHLANGKAVRFGLTLGFGGESEDFADTSGDTTISVKRSGVEDRSHQTVGVGAYYLWYTGRAAPVHGYWGVGPAVTWSRLHNERSQTQTFTAVGQPPQTNVLVDDQTSRFWRLGVAGAAGVEWLVARRVGLFAEYGSVLNYTSGKTTRHTTITSPSLPTVTEDSNRDSHGWGFSGGGGRLGVSVYY